MESVEHFENISYSNSFLATFSYIKMLKLMKIDQKKRFVTCNWKYVKIAFLHTTFSTFSGCLVNGCLANFNNIPLLWSFPWNFHDWGIWKKSSQSGGDKLNYNLQTQNIKCNEKLSFIKNFCPAYSKIFYPLGLSHTPNVFVTLYLKQFRF